HRRTETTSRLSRPAPSCSHNHSSSSHLSRPRPTAARRHQRTAPDPQLLLLRKSRACRRPATCSMSRRCMTTRRRPKATFRSRRVTVSSWSNAPRPRTIGGPGVSTASSACSPAHTSAIPS
ncbi:hypothetical protein H4R99_006534, partial [Coemansia sp. RSA 1722]